MQVILICNPCSHLPWSVPAHAIRPVISSAWLLQDTADCCALRPPWAHRYAVEFLIFPGQPSTMTINKLNTWFAVHRLISESVFDLH
jgi:hypothetical protein